MQWFYACFDCVITIFPAIGVWWYVPAFWRQVPALLAAIGTVSAAWIALDIYSVGQGWWTYNPAYVLGWQWFGLPIEEIAFFVVVPFACTALYVLLDFLPARSVRGMVSPIGARGGVLAIALCSIGLMIASGGQIRTTVDCCLAIITCVLLMYAALPRQRLFWWWNAATLGLCLICNSFLTGLPVVIYDESFMTGWRIGSIPIEDLIYNFSLLNMFLLAARFFGLVTGPRPPEGNTTRGHAQA